MAIPTTNEFRPGVEPGDFAQWLMSLTPGIVYTVIPEFVDVPSKNVSGNHGALYTARRRARFKVMAGIRYVYIEELPRLS